MKKTNDYRVVGDDVYLQASNARVSGDVVFDLNNLDSILKYYWRLNHDGYAIHTSVRAGQIFMHHLILGRKKGLETDHINRNRTDNRKENLRYASRQKNVENTGVRKDSYSKIKGVSYYKNINRWCAKIQIDGVRLFLGSRKSPKEAEELYKKAVLKYRI